MNAYTKITANMIKEIFNGKSPENYGETVRVSIPKELKEKNARCVPAMQFGTGVFGVGFHRGKKWGVIKFYSQWERSGACVGEYYDAYLLEDNVLKNFFDETVKRFS